MAAKRQVKTPESRAASLQEQTAKVRKRYKVNLNKRRKFTFEGEDELVKDIVVMLKLANYTHTQIASIAGVSRGQVKEILSDGNVQKKLVSLQAKLPQAALELGRAYLIEAVQAVVHVMRTTRDDKLVLTAAGEIFDRFGIPKVSRQEQKVSEGETEEHPISASLMEKVRAASPEVQAKAADLQEMLEEGLKQLLETPNGVSDGNS